MISRRKNWDISIKDKTLTITINLDEEEIEVGPSRSGKTLIVSTTAGAKQISDDGLTLNLNLYRKPVTATGGEDSAA